MELKKLREQVQARRREILHLSKNTEAARAAREERRRVFLPFAEAQRSLREAEAKLAQAQAGVTHSITEVLAMQKELETHQQRYYALKAMFREKHKAWMSVVEQESRRLRKQDADEYFAKHRSALWIDYPGV